MAHRSVSFDSTYNRKPFTLNNHRKYRSYDAMVNASKEINVALNLYDSHLEAIAKWLSCNGEVWGVGPTAVFASAAALFLYNELEASVFIPGDQAQVTTLEKTLVSTMIMGMLALMIHVWVCCMRFFQYYLDTIIKDSPNMLLEMTTCGLLGSPADIAMGPLTRFLRQQQPQIHITVCWFLSLCYADYVRKHYCQRFNMPYLEQWQAELHERVSRGAQQAMARANSFVGSVHTRLRGFQDPTHPAPPSPSPPPSRPTNQGINTSFIGTALVPRTEPTWACTSLRPASENEQAQEQPSLSPEEQGADTSMVEFRPKAQGGEAREEREGQHLQVRIVGQSSETTVDAIQDFRNFIKTTGSSPQIACTSLSCDCASARSSAPKLRELEDKETSPSLN